MLSSINSIYNVQAPTKRIPASLILGYFAAGNTAEEIITEFPDLDKVQIAACLGYASKLAEFEVAA
jgi:uncharacterized protein (DUF433 family)